MPEPTTALLPIADNTTRSVTLEGRALILVNRAGKLFLYVNNCPHANETLDPIGGSIMDVTSGLLRCQRHSAEFLADTGECVAGPCLGEHLQCVAFTVANGQLYLD